MIYSETASGGKTERRELRKCLAKLKPGDVLIVTRLDRLSRSTRDLLNVLAEVAEKGAAFRSISDAWAEAQTPAEARHQRIVEAPGGSKVIGADIHVRNHACLTTVSRPCG